MYFNLQILTIISMQCYRSGFNSYLCTRFCVNWVFLIAREARLKYERSENFKASKAIRKAQFAQKRVAYKLLLFETTPQSFQIY
jgi:hypothetical protein